MKGSFLGLLVFLAPLTAYAASLVTVDDLVGREFAVEDHWAGQELAFRRQDGAIKAVWRILGSGRPVVSERSFPVEIRSQKQCVFYLGGDEKRSEVKVSLSDGGEIRAYLEGIRIHITEKRPNQSPEPTPTAVTPRAEGRKPE